MGRSLVKQPNGNYGMFSSIVDGFVLLDATREELIAELLLEAEKKITKEIDATLETFATGKRNFQGYSVMEWEEAKEEHELRHPKLDEGSY
jgi:hypothetical protein